MPRTRFALVAAWTLATLLALAAIPGAGASGGEELDLQAAGVDETAGTVEAIAAQAEEAADGTEDEEVGALAELGAVLGAVGQALATAAGAIGDQLAAGALAIGHGLVAAAKGLWTGVAWTGTTIWSGLTWTGAALWTGIVATGQGLAWLAVRTGRGLAWAGTGTGDLLVWTGAHLWTGIVTTGRALALASTAAGGLIADLGTGLVAAWPDNPQHQAIVASSAGGTAAAAGAAWYTRAWRAAKYVPFLAPLYARIAREDLLDHEMRAQLYELIQENPGIHVSELGREVEASWGTLLHHLDKLEKAKLVLSEETQGKRCFFLPGQIPSDQRDILPALENETARSLAQYFATNPGATQSEAARALDLSAALVSWHVKRLEKAGVLTRTREGRTKKVGVTETAMTALA